MVRLSLFERLSPVVRGGIALAAAVTAAAALSQSTMPATYASGVADVSRWLAGLRFEASFLYGAVGVWAATAVLTRLPGRQSEFRGASEEVTCIECGRRSDPCWSGWRACRTEDPEGFEPPEITFFCPECAFREFGRRTRY